MKKFIGTIIVILIFVACGYIIYTKKQQKTPIQSFKTIQEADVYVRFDMEAYDSILSNYWAPTDQYSLPNLFKLSIERASGKSYELASSTREGTAVMLSNAFKDATSTDAKKNIALNTLIVLLYNLQPAGRNGILSTQQEADLRNNVSNIDNSKDLYKNLGLEKGATPEQVVKAAKVKEESLKNATTTEAKAQKEQIAYAKKVLTDENSKTLYDQNKIEPTIFSTKIDKTLYLYISKISPTTFIEFARAVDNASTSPSLDSMIIDFRGNVGGDLSFLQNFLGIFIGQNQYAFDLFHQGKYEVQRTVQAKFNELDRFGEIAIVTDNMSQSTAELTSATFKRLRLAKTVGITTRGWGTVENTYPINTVIDPKVKYSMLLVNSITLRDDNQPIEGRGVDPDVNTNDKNWKQLLTKSFHTSSLIKALQQTAGVPPIK